MRYGYLRAAALALAVLLAGSPGWAAKKPVERVLCDVDVVPAATLLYPYFETDATKTTGPAFTTLGSIVNLGTKNWVAHVTLWTDWAIPTMSFDLVLSPYDVQTFDLHDWLFQGPPATQVPFSGCTGNLAPGRIHLNPGIDEGATLEETLANLRKAHEGRPFDGPNGPGVKFVASSPHLGVAIGYVTIDVANRCYDAFPSTPGYFKAGGKGVASNTNAFVGDMFFNDNLDGRSVAEPAVHIRASSAFKNGDYTFYGRYVNGDGSDNRQPLGNSYGSRYFVDFPTNPNVMPETDLIVWRDVKSTWASTVPDGTEPYWVPLITTPPITTFDEQEHGVSTLYDLGLATQRVPVNRGAGIVTPYPFGWLKLSLNHGVPNRRGTTKPLFGIRAQGSVTTVFRANILGSPAAGAFRAFRLTTPCVPR